MNLYRSLNRILKIYKKEIAKKRTKEIKIIIIYRTIKMIKMKNNLILISLWNKLKTTFLEP